MPLAVARVAARGSAGVRERNYITFDALFDLSGPQHKTATGRVSMLKTDILAVLTMYTDNMFDEGSWVHFCWDRSRGCPCCVDRQESVDKTVAFTVNLLASSGAPKVCLKDFTNASKGAAKIIAGRCMKNIYGRALPVAPKQKASETEPVPAAEADIRVTVTHLPYSRRTPLHTSWPRTAGNCHVISMFMLFCEVRSALQIYTMAAKDLKRVLLTHYGRPRETSADHGPRIQDLVTRPPAGGPRGTTGGRETGGNHGPRGQDLASRPPAGGPRGDHRETGTTGDQGRPRTTDS